MSNKIKLKRGLESNLPTLDIGEPAFTTDEKNVYIGSSDGNVKLAPAEHNHDTRYYTCSETDELISSLPMSKTFVLYDDTKDTGTLYPGDAFDFNFNPYSRIEIFGKMPNSQFHIVIHGQIETSGYRDDHFEASDVIRRISSKGDSLGSSVTITCSLNWAKTQLKFHGVNVDNIFINSSTADETRQKYQICKIYGIQDSF